MKTMVRERAAGIDVHGPRTETDGSKPTVLGHLLDHFVRWRAQAERCRSAEDISEHLMRDIAFTRRDIDLLARRRTGMS
jgi:uncharacterized protein YjiS (DUF1127 family)